MYNQVNYIYMFYYFGRYEGSLHPLEGVFSFSETTVTSGDDDPLSSFRSYEMHCQNKFSTKMPFGIELVSEKGTYINCPIQASP